MLEKREAENEIFIRYAKPKNTTKKYIERENGKFAVATTDQCLNEEQSVIKLVNFIYDPRNNGELYLNGQMILMGADKEMGVRIDGDVIDTSPVKDFFSNEKGGVEDIRKWYLENGNGNDFFEILLMEIGLYLGKKYEYLFEEKPKKTIKKPWSEIQVGYGGRGPRNERETVRLETKHKEESAKLADKELDEILI